MIEQEVKLFEDFQSDMKFMLKVLLQLSHDMGDKVFGVWQIITSMTALLMAQYYNSDEMKHVLDVYGDFMRRVFDPINGCDEEDIDTFWLSPAVKSFWDKEMKDVAPYPTYNVYMFIDMPYDDPNWKQRVSTRVADAVSDEYALTEYVTKFAPIIFIYLARTSMYSFNLFTVDCYTSRYTTKDLERDICDNRIVTECIRSVQDTYLRQTMDKCYEALLDKLKSVSDLVLIGRTEKEQFELDEFYYEVAMEPHVELSGKEELLRAAGKGSVAIQKQDTEEEEYKELATQYLRSVDCVSDDEIEGIVDSHFISYSPSEAYEVIVKTF